MLAICNKNSEPNTELSRSLMEYCVKAFGQESLASIQQFANLVDDLRSEALASNTSPEAQRNGLKRYLGALEVLEERFPIGQPLSVATKVPFPATWFTWSDSFRPRNKVKGNSVRFERACVLFNFAANQSLLARDTDRSSSEGQKTALSLYQQAAGVFILLRDQILPSCIAAGDTLGTDLSDSAVSMCASLMLAQAQALFYEKAVRDKSSRGLLAKLSNQASNFYATAASTGAALRHHLDPSWENHCKFQETLFVAAAHFQQAMADKPNVVAKLSGFGHLVARLRLARDLVHALEETPNVSPAILASVNPLKEVIRSELAALEYDNNNVYIEVVPGKDVLAPIGLVPAVKATPVSLSELIDMSYVEAHVGGLDKLAPLEVKRRVEFLDSETVKIINKLASWFSQLAVYTPPVACPLDSAEPESITISDDVWTKIARIQVLGGPLALDGQLASLHGLTGDCEGLLAYITRALDEEERDDKNCRDRFGAVKFNRQVSSELTREFKTHLANYRSKCALAIDTNRKVRERIGSQEKSLVANLSKSRSEINSLWVEKQSLAAAAAALKNSLTNPATEHLKENCRAKLGVAESILLDAKHKIDQFSIAFGPQSARLADIMQSTGDPDKYIASLVANAESDAQSLQDDYKVKLAAANSELEQAYNQLIQHLAATNDSSPRSAGNGHQWLQALETCAVIVLQGFSDVSEGIAFFNKLSDYLRKLKAQVDDFCFARNEEKSGHLQNIQRALASSSNFDPNPFGNSPQINLD